MSVATTSTATTSLAIEDLVNEAFRDIDAGFINTHNEPAMTTPTVAAVTVTVVAGSTICLIC